jgi:hypothetical protein
LLIDDVKEMVGRKNQVGVTNAGNGVVSRDYERVRSPREGLYEAGIAAYFRKKAGL